jgi:hypothetical protein
MNDESDLDRRLEISSTDDLQENDEGAWAESIEIEGTKSDAAIAVYKNNNVDDNSVFIENARKRPISDLEAWKTPIGNVTKKSTLTSAEYKRNREKQRRSELNDSLDDLSDLVFQIDPSLKSGRDEAVGNDSVEDHKKSIGGKSTITNRTELIQCTVRLLRRIHSENQQKDTIIDNLKRMQNSLSDIEQISNVPVDSLGSDVVTGDSSNQRAQAATFLPTQTTYPTIVVGQIGVMSPTTVGPVSIANSGTAVSNLMLSVQYPGLLSGSGGTVPTIPRPNNQILSNGSIFQRQQPQNNVLTLPYFPSRMSVVVDAHSYAQGTMTSQSINCGDETDKNESFDNVN